MRKVSGESGRDAGLRRSASRTTKQGERANDESEYTRRVAYTRLCPL